MDADLYEDNFAAGEAELDGLDAGDAFEELDELADEFDELDEESLADEFTDAFESLDEFEAQDELDEFGDFAEDGATGLYLPRAPGPLITGPAAVGLARQLNALVVDSLDADDADAFFRRIGRAMRRVGRGIARGVRRVGGGIARGVRGVVRVARRVGRVVGPLLRRALPILQRIAGFAGPWGRLISAGLGAARGLAAGRGLRGALAGALSGAIPGVGGRLASAVLRGDGADDDAALDALADMADAGRVPAAVALPLGAGLATRIATPRVGGPLPTPLARRVGTAEATMLRAAAAAGGSAGRRLRVMRGIARVARATVRRRGSLIAAIQVLPQAMRAAARQVVPRVQQRPAAGASTRPAAGRRLAARRSILSRVPAGALYRGFAAAAV